MFENRKKMKANKTSSQRIYNIMKEIGLPAHLNGSKYVKRAIEIVYEDSSMLEGITKILYPKVADENRSTWKRVEKSIRDAIGCAWNCGDRDAFQKYFGNTISKTARKPKNGEFIATIAEYLHMEDEGVR